MLQNTCFGNKRQLEVVALKAICGNIARKKQYKTMFFLKAGIKSVPLLRKKGVGGRGGERRAVEKGLNK